jgi:hypothetical protein
VRLADGTTATLADTQENQHAYPQPAGQRKGLGFPIMRLVALLCRGERRLARPGNA